MKRVLGILVSAIAGLVNQPGQVALWAGLFTLTVACAVSAEPTNSSRHLVVSFPGSKGMLLGYLYRPIGQGPFPSIIFHYQGGRSSLMAQDITTWQSLADFLTSHGYMLFMPDRHADIVERQDYSPALRAKLQSGTPTAALKAEQTIEREDIIHRDVMAALRWFQQQPEVDANRIAIAGYLGGAIHTIYDAGNLSGVRALVAFSPGVVSWDNNAVVRGMLTASIRKSTAPIFLIYDDGQNPAPAEALGPELDLKGRPNQLKVYKRPETNGVATTNLAYDAIQSWGPDVLQFLDKTMK